MSDPENFLSRWARRKRDVAREDARAELPAAEPAPDDDANSVARPPAADGPQAPEFDLSKLPSLDSISANSDITAFLQSGVPSELKHAALRRAWVTDPAIRDFVGLAENAWDFTDPNAMPGFGALDPHIDIKKLVADIFRDVEPETKSPANVSISAPPTEQSARQMDQSDADIASAASNNETLVRREENAATQHDDIASQQDDESSSPLPAHRHGSALPH